MKKLPKARIQPPAPLHFQDPSNDPTEGTPHPPAKHSQGHLHLVLVLWASWWLKTRPHCGLVISLNECAAVSGAPIRRSPEPNPFQLLFLHNCGLKSGRGWWRVSFIFSFIFCVLPFESIWVASVRFELNWVESSSPRLPSFILITFLLSPYPLCSCSSLVVLRPGCSYK